MLSATASLGLVLLWDVEGGLTEIDKFLYSNEEAIKVTTNTHTNIQTNNTTHTGGSSAGVWCGELRCQ